MKNKAIIKWILGIFLLWRGALFLIAFLGTKFLPFREGFLGGGVEAYSKAPSVWCWANFDGVQYLGIAQKGYFQFQQALFPFFPLLLRQVNLLVKNYLVSGLLVSHLFLLIALYLFYQLVRLDFSKKVAKRSLIYLLLFPTSFYFVSAYSESLFLALVLGAFLAARKKHWWLAGLLGAFASATRFVGIFLLPALFFQWYQQNKIQEFKKIKIKELLPLFLIASGLLVYIGYLNKAVSDPLYFTHVQSLFGAGRTGGKIILLYQVFWRYLKMLVTVEKLTPTYFTVVLEVFTGGLFLILTFFSYLRRWYSYFLFMVLAYLTPTLTGTLTSMPRYVLVLFPGFILLAIWAEKYCWLKKLYPLIAIPLLIVSLLLFSRGFFVA